MFLGDGNFSALILVKLDTGQMKIEASIFGFHCTIVSHDRINQTFFEILKKLNGFFFKVLPHNFC